MFADSVVMAGIVPGRRVWLTAAGKSAADGDVLLGVTL